ncbi:hypothetical protein IJD44_04375 [bacterium]|nr:hypothetical protein [bacterium]
MTDTVKFDPGMGEFVVDFNEFINNLYSQMMSFRTIHQKRARFKLYSSKINRYIKNNLSFYLGCLLWAYYLANENKNNPKQIVGNVFSSLTEEQINDYDYLIQVNFLENYLENYERDVLYYCGQKFQIPEIWKNILSLYTEFLELNKGFTKTKTTEDIRLPEKLQNIKFDFDIKEKIEEAINKKDLEILLNIDNLTL